MPVIEPKDPSLPNFRGIHLWHDDLSSCSQRVRMVLAVKGLHWVSHLIEIPKGDNTTPEYLAINPKGLVPAFVHDGMLMIESIDIIEYLDRTFLEPPLSPRDPELRPQMEEWLKRADSAQYDLKVLSHEFLFRAVRKVSAADLENFEKNVDNDILVDFIRLYRRGDRLPGAMISESVTRTDVCFRNLDKALAGMDWLVNDALTLADIAWMPNVHRMQLMDWPLDRYPNLQSWHERVRSLDAYRKGIVDWEPPPARELLTSFAKSRGSKGHHVRNYGSLRDQLV